MRVAIDNLPAIPATDRRTGDVHFDDIVAARRVLAKHLSATPLVTHPLLSQRLGCRAFVKLENAQLLGSFKIRGGLNLLAQLSESDRARGLVTATRGNHGQSLAYAARERGVSCTIFVPEGNNPDKDAAMRALGADVRICGNDFDTAWTAAQLRATQSDARAVHPSREPALVAGYGTVALEVLEQSTQPLDFIFIPVGGGSLASGMALAIRALSPHTRIVGVQAANAPAVARAYLTGELVEVPVSPTIADGLATRVPAAQSVQILRDLIDDMVLVSEAELHGAIRCYAETVHQLAEGAGAAALAGAIKLRARIAGARIGLVLSGGNISHDMLLAVLHGEPVPTAQARAETAALASMNYGTLKRSHDH
ncbi:MAG TPA: threonine dehydratase [Steroidobacteraceae bacterium]|nr:threonine dehydratase [Steroidobacteraceae bacterium]